MAELSVLLDAVQASVQLVSGGGVQAGLADLPVHLLAKAAKARRCGSVHIKQDVHKAVHVLLIVFGVSLNQLFKGIALDIFSDQRPFAIHIDDFYHLRGLYTRLHCDGMVKRLAQNRGGAVLVKDFYALVLILIDCLCGSDGDHLLKIHY